MQHGNEVGRLVGDLVFDMLLNIRLVAARQPWLVESYTGYSCLLIFCGPSLVAFEEGETMTTIQGDIGTGLDIFGNLRLQHHHHHYYCHWVYTWGLFERASWSGFFSSPFFVGTFHIMHIAWSFIIRRRTHRRHTIVILGVFPFLV